MKYNIILGGTALALALVWQAGTAQSAAISATTVWTTTHDAAAGSAANNSEIVAHNTQAQTIYVVGGAGSAGVRGVDILDAQTGGIVGTIPVDAGLYSSVNSVAVKNGKLAVALAAATPQDPGTVLLYDLDGNGQPTGVPTAVAVGANPDMVTFTPDGSRVLVANEGEPSSDYSSDPVGSVSVISVAGATVQTAGFTAFNAQEAALEAQGSRFFSPDATQADGDATVSADAEPEYIAVSSDGSKAYVTLQENNAIAVVDLSGPTPTVTEILPLGYKDHSVAGNGLDASDRDGPGNDNIEGNIRTFDNLYGMYQPDGIALFSQGGSDYLITANEGDARDYSAFSEESRVKDLTLDGTAFPPAVDAADDDNLGRLTVTTTEGDTDNDNAYEELYAFGARSFAIWDIDGNLIFDSGDMIEQILSTEFPALWPAGRDDNKGPEPENVVVGEVDGFLFAFLGLERSDAVMAFDITNPLAPLFAGMIFAGGDVSPEGLSFIGAGSSFDGNSYLAVANEVSGTTSLFQVNVVPEPASIGLFAFATAGFLAWRRRHRPTARG